MEGGSSFVNCSKAVVGSLMKTVGLTVDDELGKSEDLGHIVLNVGALVLETIVHLVEDSHRFGNGEVHPGELLLSWKVLALEKTHHAIELQSELLVDVLLLSPLPVEFVIVLPVDQLIVVFQQIPVDRSRSRNPDFLIRCLPQQLGAIVLVQNVNQHGFSSTNDPIAIFEVGQLYFWMFL